MTEKEKDHAAQSLGARGGRARAKKMTKAQRSEAARLASRARWDKKKKKENQG